MFFFGGGEIFLSFFLHVFIFSDFLNVFLSVELKVVSL